MEITKKTQEKPRFLPEKEVHVVNANAKHENYGGGMIPANHEIVKNAKKGKIVARFSWNPTIII